MKGRPSRRRERQLARGTLKLAMRRARGVLGQAQPQRVLRYVVHRGEAIAVGVLQ